MTRQSDESASQENPFESDVVDFRHGTFHGSVAGKIQNDHYAAPRSPASWPHQVGTIPPQATCFRDRAEISRLSRALAVGGTAVVTQVAPAAVVVGLGGVGKTQLAAHYARTCWQIGGLDVLVWLTATSRSAVTSGYAQAAAELLGSAAPQDPHQAAAAFLAWLEPKSGQPASRWLVVLDNVTDPGDLNGLWPPDSPRGRTLVTTRRQEAALTIGRRVIDVGVFTPGEAVAYLIAALAPRAEPRVQLVRLADDLGHLPLALSQAAAYLTDTGLTAAEYRQMLADRTVRLRDAAPDSLPDSQVHTVAASWSLSIEHADLLRPAGLSHPLLMLASLLDANGIPEAVLTSSPARAYLACHHTFRAAADPPAEHQEPVPARDVLHALTALRRVSLIQHTPAAPETAVRVHQLTQRAVRDTLTSDQLGRAARAAADALLDAWPEVARDTALTRVLRGNTTALNACAEEILHQPKTHAVLFRAGRSLGEAGHFTEACAYFRDLIKVLTSRRGPDHPRTIAARYRLAHWQGEAGDIAGATSLLADVVADRIRLLGADHPDTFASRHDFARLRGTAGDAAGAATAFAELLPDVERVLGPDHPGAFTTRLNRAWWQDMAENGTPSETTAGLVADLARVLGTDHPQALGARLDLAHAQGKAGDAVGAASALATLLHDLTRVLGPNHPQTLRARAKLAHWQGGPGSGNAQAAT
ncbi:tetratricopeptide repeat protein [Streptomyces sp. NPDC051016]|uniref:tetratricopeptide repeat protein n=1 Tax=Streptomyces sp. NPDC051016 TaxID=3365638 RepID=UPI0037977919